MSRTIEYSNEFSHGPKGTEFLVPFKTLSETCPFSRFADQSQEQIQKDLSANWQSSEPATTTVAAALAKFVPRSNYRLEPPSNSNWLLLEHHRFILFLNDFVSKPRIELPQEFNELMRHFGGFQFGFKPGKGEDFLLPSAGFFSCDLLKRVDESDEAYLWEDDETVIGGVYFYSTDCGNQFCYRSDGSIAKWNMGSSTIEDAFPTIMDFADEFKNYYTAEKVNRESMF